MIHLAWCVVGMAVLAARAEPTVDPRSLITPELPGWLKPSLQIEPLITGSEGAGESTPTRMLLVEDQTDVAGAEDFYHYAYRIETEAGLQSAGQISVDFAPGYQTLQWHFLRIWRDGKSRTMLEPAAVQVLRQEENAERFLYHGRMTALVILHDLRVGDVVETAYTRKGHNPVFAGRYSTALAGASSTPVDRLYYRIREVPGHPLQISTEGGFKPVHQVENVDGTVEHTWVAEGIKAVNLLSDVPSRETQYPYVQVTDYTSWKEVRDWARALFPDASTPSPELTARVEAITAPFKTQDEKAEALLRFVQDDIRYLGIHLNESTHRPMSPAEVLERRFGDCKDKSWLLVAMLRSIGIKADVALVNATRQRGLLQLQPSPLSFDHAIVRVTRDAVLRRGPSLPSPAPTLKAIPSSFPADKPLFNDDTTLSMNISSGPAYLWLDPTMTLQGGPITCRHVPEYGYALLLSDAADGLVEIEPTRAANEVDVRETYIMTDVTTPAQMELVSTYRGGMADYYRYVRRVIEPARYTQQLTGYLTRFYPKIKSLGPIEWSDDREANVVTAHTRFEVPEFWVTDAQARYRRVEVYPWSFIDRLPRPETTDRAFSFALPYPLTIRHRSEFVLPKDWPTSSDSHEIDDDTFTFNYAAQCKGRNASASYCWQTRADAVPATRLGDWIKKMSEVRATFGYQLQQNIRLATLAKREGIVWSLVASAIAGVGVGLGVGMVLYWWRPKSVLLPPPMDSAHLAGIGGWLILSAIGVVLRPLILLGQTEHSLALAGNLSGWTVLTDLESGGFRQGFAWFAWSEIFMLTVLLGWSSVMVFQFFRRKASLPISLISIMGVTCLWTVVHTFWGRQVLTAITEAEKSRTAGVFFWQVLILALWVPYFLVSRRVKATFRA